MTDRVNIRNIGIGGGLPVTVQSMLNADPCDHDAVIAQIRALEQAGCDIIRLTVPDEDALAVFRKIRKETDSPLVADIHFDYKLAIGALESGADKIRINPGNIGSRERVAEVVRAAKDHGVPIRVGVNSGSLERDILEKYGTVTAEALCESALRNAAVLDDMDFHDIVLSIKASDVRMTYDAYRMAAAQTTHPLHIGVTEAGTPATGKIKSAAGIGGLLLAGIGDTLRVSLTADPVEEVRYGRKILEAVGLRKPKFDLVSCPTCGRTKIDLEKLASDVEDLLAKDPDVPEGIRVAVMGCVVNGPGEARESDYGVCGGTGEGLLMKNGEVIAKVKEEDLAKELLELIRRDQQ